jgi:hypothetical protein
MNQVKVTVLLRAPVVVKGCCPVACQAKVNGCVAVTGVMAAVPVGLCHSVADE